MKKKILFVDDDPVLLQFYQVIMTGEKERWEVTTADDPRRALEQLGREPVDVLVSDLRMPGMDGFQFMREVSQRYPRAARITVSALQDQEELARCLGATHQFLPKPFDIKLFKATLARVGDLNLFLEDRQLQTVVSKLSALPSFPSLYLEIQAEMSREQPSLEAVAAIVAKDPGMTAKLLQVVNSAAFGRARKMSTPLEAVQYLGIATIHSLALSAHTFSSLDKVSAQTLSLQSVWDHAVQTGSLARLLLQAEGAEPDVCEAAYTSGLLHDVGKLLLAQNLPDLFRQAREMARQTGVSFVQAESEVFGATHAGVGAYLLGLWGLPAAIVEAVAFHHHPCQTENRLLGPLAGVHIANFLVNTAGGVHSSNGAPGLDGEYLAALGISEHLDRWRSLAAKLPSANSPSETAPSNHPAPTPSEAD